MKIWPWAARNEAQAVTRKHAVPEVIDVVPQPEPEVVVVRPWEASDDPMIDLQPAEHVRMIVAWLQEIGETGYVPSYKICRYYPEIAWIANVRQMPRRSLEFALSSYLRKQKKRLGTGGLIACYLIPSSNDPVPVAAVPEQKVSVPPANVVAFASKPARVPAQPRATRRKGESRAAA